MSAVTNDFPVAQAVLDLSSRPDGFDVLELLHDLTAYTVRLGQVHSAGVTILDETGRVDYLTASDEVCARLEEAQLDLDEGPCVDSARSGEVLPPLLLHPAVGAFEHWPLFAPRALAEGYSSVAAVPLRISENSLGSLNLLQKGSSPISATNLHAAQLLADATAVRLHHRQTLLASDEVVNQLTTALQSRIVIEQAKGMLAQRLGIDVDAAFKILRGHARSRQLRLIDVARRITRRDFPAEFDRTN
ncbi:GAF and ANTAR domain-containing protein [Streptomyces sp. HUAS MG91]|uniref:GAF and ANTAR domain-containing protein n=1 Tax=Streptomyces tabacisoli TaxID=3156398 RepID=A0AAU8IVV9_9ACTN